MDNSSSEQLNARETCDLGPLTLAIEGHDWRFTLTAPTEMTLELPPNYEHFLREKLEPFFESSAKPAIEMDLQNLPAISSRQLGLMIALQKNMSEHSQHLRMTGISPGVRRLLNLTRTEQFFEIA